jgi:hypothetical protein
MWSKKRQKHLCQRWMENSKHQNIEWWKNFFEYVKESKFLTGLEENPDGRPPFIANLEWLIKPENFIKVIEGSYHRGRN